MAHYVEPMVIDNDFDNKENSLHHSNVLPFTEKGYEELDVTELNMKLRYSVTPTPSPMSKSYTANCYENRSQGSGDDNLNITVNDTKNLTRSLNSTISKNDNVLKSVRVLPLQRIQTDQFADNFNRSSILGPVESTTDNGNINVTITAPSEIDENLSSPSSVSPALQTPEATTPTKDEGSPIMRGLKSVLNMFRSSQSPIPPPENETVNPSLLSPVENLPPAQELNTPMLVSTPISTHRKKEMSPTKRISPVKDSSVVFNQDLEKELQWKDETTIFFSQERIPIHKLLPRQPQTSINLNEVVMDGLPQPSNQDQNFSVDYMDISYNVSMTDIDTEHENPENTLTGESDTEFVDCETTLTKNVLQVVEDIKMPVVDTESSDYPIVEKIEKPSSRLKQIILNTTQDILDATLSVRPEDLLPEITNHRNESTIVFDNTDIKQECKNFDQTFDDIKSASAEPLLQNLNATKIIEVLVPTTEPNDETLTEISCAVNVSMMENVDVNISQKTTAISEPPDDAENINATSNVDNLIHNNRICNQEFIASGELYLNSPLNQSRDLNVKDAGNSLLDNTNIVTHIATASKFTPYEGAVGMPLSIKDNFEVNHIKEEIINQLPINIPLPDEDLENDLAIDDDLGNKITDTLHLGQEIKTSEIGDSTIVYSEGADNTDVLNKSDQNQLPGEYTILRDPDTSNKITDSQTILDAKIHKNIEPEETIICENSSFQVEQVFQNQKNTAMNATQNFSTLPDILNQTVNKMENIESLPLTVISNTEKLTTEVDIESNSEVLPEASENEKQNQISNLDTDEPKGTIEGIILQKKRIRLPDTDISEISVDIPNNSKSTLIITDNEILTPESIRYAKPSTTINLNFNKIAPPAEEIDYTGISSKSEQVVEELVLSENSSPFVSVTADYRPASLEERSKPLEATDTSIPKDGSSSPPISTKGYYFNFDDMNFNPFASKINIRMSPPIDVQHKPDTFTEELKTMDTPISKKDFNRRKSHPNKKKLSPPKRKLNSSLDGIRIQKVGESLEVLETVPMDKIILDPPTTLDLSPKNVTINDEDIKLCDINNVLNETTTMSNNALEIEPKTCNNQKIEHTGESVTEINTTPDHCNVNELKTASSSELSTYFSVTSSSDSSVHSRNVFNIPEIDDRNFNPFATKCKMRQSPPPSLNIENACSPGSKVEGSPDNSVILSKEEDMKAGLLEDKIDAELMEKDTSSNLSNTTISSKTDERNITTREIHTEDEDTVEGPFLDADETDFSDNITNFEGENVDMVQFNVLPSHNNVDNIDTGEMFIDAEAFEFLLNQNKSNTIVDSGKESLFLKFDPLFAKRMSVMKSDGVVASLAALQKRESIPLNELQSSSQKTITPIAGPSNINITQNIDFNSTEDFNDDLNITVSKPMMVVPPAVNPVTPRNKSLTPNRSNRRSITFTSPAMAVIDRLLSLSMNNSPEQDPTLTQVSREQNEADIALSQLRELLAEKEISVYNLKSESKELKNRLNTLETLVKNLELESNEKLKKINQLNETLVQKTKMNKSMATVVEEYERTIASLISESARDKKKHAEERLKLTNERDEQTAHLASMEVSFNDIHSKYEKSKQVIFQCKANEDMLKKSIRDFEENLSKMQNNYELLKQHATSKLNHANQELEKINKSHEAEVLKLNAMIKRKDLHITSLEESLIQKTKANEELTAICDELINKVS